MYSLSRLCVKVTFRKTLVSLAPMQLLGPLPKEHRKCSWPSFLHMQNTRATIKFCIGQRNQRCKNQSIIYLEQTSQTSIKRYILKK